MRSSSRAVPAGGRVRPVFGAVRRKEHRVLMAEGTRGSTMRLERKLLFRRMVMWQPSILLSEEVYRSFGYVRMLTAIYNRIALLNVGVAKG